MTVQTTLMEIPIIEQSNPFFKYIKPKMGYLPIYDKIISFDTLFQESFPELKDKGVSFKITEEMWCGACWDVYTKTVRVSGPNQSDSSPETICEVMFHELTHARNSLAHDIPSGERATDIYSLARLPVEIIKRCKGFSYIKVPKDVKSVYPGEVGRLANQAIIQRSLGVRQYIKWFENECAKLSVLTSF